MTKPTDRAIRVQSAFDKMLIRFYGTVIISATDNRTVDAVREYLESIDTGQRPDPARIASIKSKAIEIANEAHAQNVVAGRFAARTTKAVPPKAVPPRTVRA